MSDGWTKWHGDRPFRGDKLLRVRFRCGKISKDALPAHKWNGRWLDGHMTSSKSGSRNSYPFHYDPPSIAPDRAREIVIQAACKLKVEAEFEARFVAVPNGTYTASHRARAGAKREGVSKGFPDAIIVGTGRNRGRTAFAEFKAKGAMSPWQLAWLTALHEDGHDCGLFRSEQTLADWLRQRGWW